VSAARQSGIADDPRVAIRAKVAATGTSFYWAMRLMPEPRRDGLFAVYAYCREVDDIADSDDPPAVKRAGLAQWRREVDEIFDDAPDRPLSRVLADVARDYGLRREDFLAVIDGMEMDAATDIRAPDLA
jgi:presqualene diphosphate synthase